MLSAINAGLRLEMFSLYPVKIVGVRERLYRFTIDGLDAVASADADFREIRIDVIICPSKVDETSTVQGGGCFDFADGDCGAVGWLERDRGFWLQDVDGPMGTTFKCRSHLVERLARLEVVPDGYAAKGDWRGF